MQVQAINNNYNKQSFGAKYLVKGNKQEVRAFYEKANKFIDITGNGNLMLQYNPDIILICTDEASKKANQAFQKTYEKAPFTLYPKFTQLPLDTQLKKIFEDGAKDVKQYEAKDILYNPNFDIAEGIIK